MSEPVVLISHQEALDLAKALIHDASYKLAGPTDGEQIIAASVRLTRAVELLDKIPAGFMSAQGGAR